MTEPTQNRIVSGLAPRRPQVTGDLSRLQAKNRTPVPPPPSTSTPTETPSGPTATTDDNAGKKRITVYIDNEIFTRARGVHKATAHLEDDRSWSQFIEKALLREVEARERSHNNGKRYSGSDTPLSPGRPLSS
ncbi:hypothetical protein CH278_12815 [Rhodococcus sp. 05-2254-5]|jgi:hypothetical protein|uniref:ParB family protein n=1 Tax=unclassified Rhodococcus (in: high G+C Gram-positive bacteria) TaxID=192944 RepID=UPI000B9C1822|nr:MULTISPECIES: hypothetical protein [unclassified Rhodococcus (in: high G+C Gram-positive bacteria)]OZE33504.1 hypothetical protein CH278_12815 [Rhodococcus sp. 05-2254-5]OZE51022.1 hypothetical protein CH269_25760 [Rhodococcus sp. 05-2254-1]OZF42473.1 hypothetical protein CH291_26130 [Rhodococcus sp. 14-1411-2a]